MDQVREEGRLRARRSLLCRTRASPSLVRILCSSCFLVTRPHDADVGYYSCVGSACCESKLQEEACDNSFLPVTHIPSARTYIIQTLYIELRELAMPESVDLVLLSSRRTVVLAQKPTWLPGGKFASYRTLTSHEMSNFLRGATR